MNFLAHFRLAEQTPDGWTGAWLGDFVKGRIDGRYPPSLARGIVLHRRIDSGTDAHLALARSRRAMSPVRRRFAASSRDVVESVSAGGSGVGGESLRAVRAGVDNVVGSCPNNVVGDLVSPVRCSLVAGAASRTHA